ncbi:MAG: acyl-CoA dehydrogenase, partial [Nitriliruptorales bacterium]|nr:acyl-CoA dehydrogenase [Nitriliruptorales bacterium]
MSIALTEEHRALADSVRGWAGRFATPEVARAVMGGGSTDEIWSGLVEQGLLALHVPEEHGGAGYGLPELAVVAEELGRACAPGPWLPTVLASAVIAELGDEQLCKELLPGLADGSQKGCVGFDDIVLGAPDADVFILVSGDQVTVHDRDGVEVTQRLAFDATRSIGRVTATSGGEAIDATPGAVRELAATILAAEAAGLSGWCLDTAVAYAKVREQFGRPIGQFQGVKHLAAEMLAKVEMMRAAAWDAAQVADDPEQRPLAAAVAAASAFDPAVEVAKDCIQILGGIGFTWEHDAHLYLKRATAVRQLIGGNRTWRREVTEIITAGTRRTLDLTLEGDEAEAARTQTRAFLDALPSDDRERDVAIADAGYVMPHWPAPWGRDASAVEQLVIDEEFARAGVRRRNLVIGGWILPTIIEYGTEAQQEQFIRPTLYGDIVWAQMFSEPGAGSDLAALQTKAVKADGGWVLNGQKVWTT